MRPRPVRAAFSLLVLTACAGPDAPAPTPPNAAADLDACRALLAAAPTDWATRLPPVLALGPAAAPVLVQLLRQDPTAPGAQAAVAGLGRLGDAAAVPFLRETVQDHGELAVEAALALGELGAAATVDLLRDTMHDRLADATLRTAAAATLIRLGQGQPAREFSVAVLLAGTPEGQPGAAKFGLPSKTRWALERHLLMRALMQVANDDFGLDTDAPWPALAAATARVDAWLAAH